MKEERSKPNLSSASGCINVLTDARCGGCVRRDAAGEMRGAREGVRWVFAGRPGDDGQRREGVRNSAEETARAGTQRTGACENQLTDACCGGCVRRGGAREMCGAREGWSCVSKGDPSERGDKTEADSARSSCWRRSTFSPHFLPHRAPVLAPTPESIKECARPPPVFYQRKRAPLARGLPARQMISQP
jgi:hypothetical protein